MRELTVIYQDPCGASPWCARTRRLAANAGIKLNRISFVTPYAKEMLAKAKEQTGWHGVPVITDGKKWSADIEDFIEKTENKKDKRG